MMDVFKKIVGRRNMVAVADENSNYQKEITKADRFSYRPPALVTSTSFDNDEKFMIVAKLLLFRHEQEGCTVKDSINSTLTTSEEKRTFLEAVELRHTTIQFQREDELTDAPMDVLVLRLHSIFVKELKSLWRQSVLSGDESISHRLHGPDDSQFRCIRRTPKHNIHSPMKSEAHAKSAEKSVSTRPRSSKHRRRRFFAENDQSRRRSSIKIEFKLNVAQPVQSLQLDGFSQPPLGSYAPPSPIVAR